MKVFIVVSIQPNGISEFERIFNTFDAAEAWVNDMYDKGFSLEYPILEVDSE